MSPKPSQPKITRSSTCLCKSVSFNVTGVDKGAVLCHCSNCQRASGSAFAHNFRLLNSDLKYERGEDVVRRYADGETTSGNTLLRHFCGRCGSPLFLLNPQVEGLVVLHTGTMQDRTPPKFELFAQNRHVWVGDVTGKAKL